jgi:hypothetical protein
MRTRFLGLLAPILALSALSLPAELNAEGRLAMSQPKKKCITIGDKRICLEDFGNKKNDDGDDGEAPKKTGNICEGDNECPPGYIDLETPNKYKACCEPKEGFPDTTPAPAPAPAPGECQLCSSKGDCSGAGNEGECAQRKATAEQMTVDPFLKWSCKCTPGPAPAPAPEPTGPAPKKVCPDGSKIETTQPCPGEQHCTTCGGPGCLQNGTPCPFGGITTCRPIPDKTYYNCCCP